MPIHFNKSVINKLIKHLSDELTIEQLQAAEILLEQQKTNTKESFKLTIKAFLTFTVYFTIVPYFGWFLYSLVIIVLFLISFGLYFAYLLMDILPAIFTRFQHHVSLYLTDKIQEEL